jgi:hypothetical protein
MTAHTLPKDHCFTSPEEWKAELERKVRVFVSVHPNMLPNSEVLTDFLREDILPALPRAINSVSVGIHGKSKDHYDLWICLFETLQYHRSCYSLA